MGQELNLDAAMFKSLRGHWPPSGQKFEAWATEAQIEMINESYLLHSDTESTQAFYLFPLAPNRP